MIHCTNKANGHVHVDIYTMSNMQNIAILILRAIYCGHLSQNQILRKKDRKVNNLFTSKWPFQCFDLISVLFRENIDFVWGGTLFIVKVS